MLIGFPPIFMADTKVIYGYNFAAALTCRKKNLSKVNHCSKGYLFCLDFDSIDRLSTT